MSALYVKNDEGVFVPILTIKGDQGDSLQFLWDGTRLGVKRNIDANYQYVDLEGQPGVNSDMFKAVYDTLNEARDVFAYDPTISGLDATKVKTALDELSLYSHTHINLINPALLVNGYIHATTGNLTPSANYRATDFLPVVAGQVYSCNAEAVTYPCFYDTNKAKLSAASSHINFTVPADALYMRVSFENAVTPNKMLNLGATLLTYVPYNEPKLALKTGYRRDSVIEDLFTDSAVTAYVNAMVKTQSKLYGLKWAVLGDSITQGAEQKYHSYIAARTGCTILNYGAGGTSIKQRAGRSDSMSERYTTMDDSADIVTVFAGVNDSNTDAVGTMADRTIATLYGACHVLFGGLRDKYAGKRLGVISPIGMYTVPKSTVVEVMREVARYYNIKFLDLFYEGGIYIDSATVRAAIFPDGLHPNAAGHLLLSWNIQNFIEQLS
jgi:lysophospholipase L1-like esterase